MPNEGDGKGRKAGNVVKVRALWIDLDGAPLEPVVAALEPHITVESSPGRFHAYWLVSDCPLEQFKPMQKAIAAQYNGDSACCDLARVMRLPGFWHLKDQPVMTKLITARDDLAVYTLDEIKTGLLPETMFEHTSNIPRTVLEVCSHETPVKDFEIVSPKTGEVINLRKWAAANSDFDIIGSLKQHAPQVLRGEQTADGKQHIRCPFESEHSEQHDDMATFVVNTGNGHDSWAVHCCHAHCDGRDRLDHIKSMLRAGWLSFDALSEVFELRMAPKIYLPVREMQIDPLWCALTFDERMMALALFELSARDITGTLPDDNFLLRRWLGGIEEDRWLQYREELSRIGWLQSCDGRIWNELARLEVTAACRAYSAKCAGGRKGRSGKERKI
ncbi:MAG: DNA-primase RepB domain-containing protein [Oryzomonas sp.]|uniref:DNA-primase RepB domain-containing protein n=1 Tax=Oryzomonas sp. TaxID=2855186 RepID=UPI00284FDF21|nr:DNA-primase RepB domain-containing protein [Oryzomonas sp.]MDR3581583.1 DNA-primase RepB domain-containing protein [Oryzomonas sp.]